MTAGSPTLHPYSAYKETCDEWFGDVPAHWEVRRTKTLLKTRNEKGFRNEPLLAATQTKGVVRKDQYEHRTVLALKDLQLLKLVREGDFVISLRSFQGGIEYARNQGIISPAYTVLYSHPPRVQPYLALLFKSSPYIENLTLHVTGIRQGQNIDYSELSRSYLPLPPLEEQAAIVRYLGYVDWRVRRYVRAKGKLIGLLEEEKQAIINQAVTRGLDPSVRLKPSGVEWLGDVPEHWAVRRIGQFSKVGNGSTPSRQNPSYWSDGTYPWLTSSSVNQDTISSADQFVTETALLDCHLPKVQPGSVLIGITGQGKTRGMSTLLGLESTINQHMAYITPRDVDVGVSSRYLHVYLTAAYRELRALSESSGSTKSALTCEDVKHFQVAIPPRREQDRLVTDLKKELAIIDAAIARAQRQIELLEEYRTRLIADVVTGKVDVREAAAGLADEGDGDLRDADGLG